MRALKGIVLQYGNLSRGLLCSMGTLIALPCKLRDLSREYPAGWGALSGNSLLYGELSRGLYFAVWGAPKGNTLQYGELSRGLACSMGNFQGNYPAI